MHYIIIWLVRIGAAAIYRRLNHLLFCIYSVVIKILPCIILTVVSVRLINSLVKAKRQKDRLLQRSKETNDDGSSRRCNEVGACHRGGGDRTTRMLLAVLLLFLGTEFPQGILGLLSGLLDESFFRTCYIPLGDILDFAALSNSALNFILYTAMSNKFRQTFMQIFFHKQIYRKVPIISTLHVRDVSTAVTTGL
jgi:hypothetical protein